MQPLRGWLGRRRPLKRRLVCAYRCRRSSARSVLRPPGPRLGGQGDSTRRERHSGDQGFPRSANHQSPPRPQLPPSRKGQSEWDAEYVRVRWAVTRRPCVASPGAIEFAGGEAPRRYNSRASGQRSACSQLAPRWRTVLIQPTEIRRHRGEMAAGPTRRAGPIGGSRPTSGCRASVDRRLPGWVASDGSRIKSVDLVISCPSGTPFPSSQRERLVPMPPAPSRPAQGVVDFAKRPPLVGGDVRTDWGSKRLG